MEPTNGQLNNDSLIISFCFFIINHNKKQNIPEE